MLDRRRFLAASTASLGLATLQRGFAKETVPADWTVHTKVPNNREVALPQLIESFLTPVERFYVRSHAPVPQVKTSGDSRPYRLEVSGLVQTPLSLTLSDLAKKFSTAHVTATMTCAGNRRYEHSKVEEIKGVPWREGAIGHAKWTGVDLADVLKAAGLKPEAKHVWFEGLDQIERPGGVIPFGASIPIERAMNPYAGGPGALVCVGMNDAPLTPDHGYPVRSVVPGYIGARSVKWLGKIVVSDRPSPNHYQATAYKIIRDGSPLEWAEKAPIYRFPINCAICTPMAEAEVTGPTRVAGYALPPGDETATVARVEVSADGGRRWQPATLLDEAKPLSWVRWETTVDVKPRTRMLIARAVDSRGEMMQPSVPWNLKGYLYNGWHRVRLG